MEIRKLTGASLNAPQLVPPQSSKQTPHPSPDSTREFSSTTVYQGVSRFLIISSTPSRGRCAGRVCRADWKCGCSGGRVGADDPVKNTTEILASRRSTAPHYLPPSHRERMILAEITDAFIPRHAHITAPVFSPIASITRVPLPRRRQPPLSRSGDSF